MDLIPDDPQGPHNSLLDNFSAIFDHFINAQSPVLAFVRRIVKVEHFISYLLNQITNVVFRNRIMRLLGQYIKDHPYQTAFFIVGLVLVINPLALAGFGALGPVAGMSLTISLLWFSFFEEGL
jgi:hypothetical protein